MGKAKNLKKRLASYRRQKQETAKTLLLVKKAKLLKFIELESDLEATLAEANLVKVFQPKYNIQLKDDKSPIYIKISREPYPRVLTVRKNELGNTSPRNFFGPYASAYQTREVLKIARRLFPFCNSSPQQKNKKLPCFYSHLNLCPGACTGKISPQEYQKNIIHLKLFLQGKRKTVEKKIKKEMLEAAKNLEFESAAENLKKLKQIESLLYAHTANFNLSLHPKDISLTGRIELWRSLAPFFFTAQNKTPGTPLSRIEAYDISNLSGKEATASMVVFTQGLKDSKEFRKFKIHSPDNPNDTLMIREALTRRLKHREWKYPDLIIVDGGKGQVQSAYQALAGYGLQHIIPLIGIAKRLEEIVIYRHLFHILKFRKSSPALQLVLQLRDEAHRFAKNYHLLLRQKKSFT